MLVSRLDHQVRMKKIFVEIYRYKYKRKQRSYNMFAQISAFYEVTNNHAGYPPLVPLYREREAAIDEPLFSWNVGLLHIRSFRRGRGWVYRSGIKNWFIAQHAGRKNGFLRGVECDIAVFLTILTRQTLNALGILGTHLPVVNGRLLGHQLVYTQSTLYVDEYKG